MYSSIHQIFAKELPLLGMFLDIGDKVLKKQGSLMKLKYSKYWKRELAYKTAIEIL